MSAVTTVRASLPATLASRLPGLSLQCGQESVLLALISYFATRIRPTCTNRSARCISWRQAKKQRKSDHLLELDPISDNRRRSAPHTYVTDRLCVVVSGTWWCNSGDDFDPASCVPVPAGSFVRRVAGTPHYDGVIRDHAEPAIIAICGMGPVGYKLVDSSKPGWRPV